jgi:hypothetical protein
MTVVKPSRTYTIQYGGGTCPDDFYYDEDELTVFEGDTCPQCNNGKMQISSRNKLYCSKLCWLNGEQDDNS